VLLHWNVHMIVDILNLGNVDVLLLCLDHRYMPVFLHRNVDVVVNILYLGYCDCFLLLLYHWHLALL